ncbi:hypothetical protein [Candidatus Palauibacter sp.]|uniref:hypothetical protein n=1 Tax=Candidatus Palauibacter sp. TaxID=3101350 RepID=UPI003B51F220
MDCAKDRNEYLVIIALLIVSAVACGDDAAPVPMVPEARAPQSIGTIPNQVVMVGRTITLDVSPYFSDPDGGSLTYTAASSAAGIISVSQSASVLTLVGVAQGSATITVMASDPDRLTVSQSFQTVVEAANLPPVVVTAIPTQQMRAGQAETVQMGPYFRDPDGDALSFTASSDRERVVVASVSGSRLVLVAEGAGTAMVTVMAADPAALTATQSVRVTVRPPNQAPEPRGTIAALSLSVKDTVILTVSSYFRDPDGDELSYSATSDDEQVATVTVSGSTATLVGVAEGTATLSVAAADPDGFAATQNTRVTVADPNVAPRPIGAIPAQNLPAGDTATLVLSSYFGDANADELSFTASVSDKNVATATVTGSLLTLVGVRAGSTTLTVTAADPEGLTATQRANLTVEVVSGGFRDDFDSVSSLADWNIVQASASVSDGVLRLGVTNPSVPAYAAREPALPVTSWKIRARYGRTGTSAPSVVWYTGDSRWPAFRLELANHVFGYDYAFAFYDGLNLNWLAATNMSGYSDAVRTGSGELTDVTISFEDGTLVIVAGETELVRHSVWRLEGMQAALESITEIWLAGFRTGSALFDYFELSGLSGAAASAHPLPASVRSETSFLTSRWGDLKVFDGPKSSR